MLPRVGAQRPTHLLTPEGLFDFSDGDAACELAEVLGLSLLDWQRWLVRWILATDDHGRPACNTVVIVVPRQNGKSAILEAVELFWLLVAEVPTVFHTAHEADTAAGHMERIESMTTEPPIDLPEIKTFKANGKERTRNLDDNLLLQYRTRTKSTKRGSSPQRVVLDECQELEDAHLAALVPSLAAQSMNAENRPQLIYSGSAPLAHSAYMHRLLAQVQSQRPDKTLLAMWACEPDDDPMDVDNWYRSNPSLGHLISEEWVRETEFLVLAPDDFAAERLGVPKAPSSRGAGPISLDRWEQLVDAESLSTDQSLSLGLDAPLDRATACFSVWGRRPDNAPHAAIRYWVETEDIDKIVDVAKSLTDGHGVRINVPPKSPALAWREAFEAAGVVIHEVKQAEFIEAQQAIEQDVADGTLRHRGQIDMTTAVGGLVARTSGDSSPWSRRSSSSNVAPMMALAAARAGGRGRVALGNPMDQISI